MEKNEKEYVMNDQYAKEQEIKQQEVEEQTARD